MRAAFQARHDRVNAPGEVDLIDATSPQGEPLAEATIQISQLIDGHGLSHFGRHVVDTLDKVAKAGLLPSTPENLEYLRYTRLVRPGQNAPLMSEIEYFRARPAATAAIIQTLINDVEPV